MHDTKALRCRIRYSSKSIRGTVVETVLCTLWPAFNRWNDKPNVNVNRNDNDWNDNWWFAGVRNSLHFSPALPVGEFCLISCPLQPPSILPISFKLFERLIYFLSSSDLVSQRIMRNTLIVSTFLSAKRTYGSFSCRERKAAVTMASTASTKIVSIRCPNECRCVFGSI